MNKRSTNPKTAWEKSRRRQLINEALWVAWWTLVIFAAVNILMAVMFAC